MSLYVKDRGADVKFSLFIDNKLKNLIEKARITILKETRKIFIDTIESEVGWRSPGNIASSADYDLDSGSDGNSSIREAITEYLQEVSSEPIDSNFRGDQFFIGHLNRLLQLNPRILYFEFGTLHYQEYTKIPGIIGFSGWKNPYIRYSELRIALGPNHKWGFLPKSGVGRFGEGIMVPAAGRIKEFKGIEPVRMFRGSGTMAFEKILTEKERILKKIIMAVKEGDK